MKHNLLNIILYEKKAAKQDKGTKQQHQRSLSSSAPSYTVKTRENI